MFKWLKKIFQSGNPRYFYQLDEIKYQNSAKNNLYIFKIYSSPTFAKLTFDEIKNDEKLRWLINPDDLIKIYIHEEQLAVEKSKYRIKEMLRGNNYILTMQEEIIMLSGDEFCSNSALIEQTYSLDVYRISHSTAFQAGRRFTKEIVSKVKSETKKINYDNVVQLVGKEK